MCSPRLELLRELLPEDGSVRVTIDNNEVHYLKVIMDEILGRKIFLPHLFGKKRMEGELNRNGSSVFMNTCTVMQII